MSIELKVPAVGESISEVEIGQWLKNEGDAVADGETLAILESEKATVELPSPAAGTLGKLLKEPGSTAAVGEVIATIHPVTARPSKAGAPAPDAPPATDATPSDAPRPADNPGPPPAEAHPARKVMPAAARILGEAGIDPAQVTGTGPGGRLLKEDALKAVSERKDPQTATPTADKAAGKAPEPDPAPHRPPPPPPRSAGSNDAPERQEEAVRMSRLRRTVAARLVAAQQDMALLTTFNEIDMSTVMALRKEVQEAFQQRHGVKLGFMSFFIKAVIDALKSVPQLNAEIRDDHIIYRNYYDIGVAIGGGRGLVVPVLRNAERMGFAQVEKAIADFAARAKEGHLKPDELEGGTFTISNGGVYGSLLSTPIVSPPQSGVLGMHSIQDRPVARDGQVVVRPMMYVALTYDHRIVDGREAVGFLRRVKEIIENPARILLEA